MPYTTQQWKAARRKAAYAQMGGTLAGAGGLTAFGTGAIVARQSRRLGDLKNLGFARKVMRYGYGGMIAGGLGLVAAGHMRKRANRRLVGSAFEALKRAPMPWDHKGRSMSTGKPIMRFTPQGYRPINTEGIRAQAAYRAKLRSLGYT